jgi:hypothetical protein
MADFRRAIRLGRLLRQEDTVIISDLVGLACIHLGTRGIYERAQTDGDMELALLASVVLGEVAPQRLRSMELLTSTDLMENIEVTEDGEVTLALHPGKLEAVAARAESTMGRRFRLEAILSLNIVRTLGQADERQRAEELLMKLTKWSLDHVADREQLKKWAVPANQ